jgi:RHS repeat-associated protein
LKIGRASTGTYFGGLIDEARVSNSAVYTGNFTPQTHLTASSGTKGLWKFDSQSTSDSSGNGNNGTTQGGATYSDDVPSGDGGGGTTSGGTGTQIQWLVADHLGTPRMIFDQSGSLANVRRHDYLPFGEDILGTVSGRSTVQGFGGGDAVRQKFTSKESDDETGLDYFGARFFASVHGRFTSPDPLLLSNKSALPQSWNRYSYCINSPLKYVDPTGLIWGTADFEENGRHYRRYQWFNGNKVGKGFTPFIPAKDGTDIVLRDGGSARIWGNGSRQYFPAAPAITVTGQDNLNLSAGLAHGAATAFVNGSPVGQLVVDWAFNQVGGVEHNSNLYQNGHTIGEWTITGSLILAAPALGGESAGGGSSSRVVVNLGGEGEVSGALNVQGKWVLDEGWRASRAGQSLPELQAAGHEFAVADNTALPFANQSVDRVITNSVPIDKTTFLGPGVQSSEAWRILRTDGLWINNGKVVPR